MQLSLAKSTKAVLTLLTLTIAVSACTRPAQVVSVPRTIDKPTIILPTVDPIESKEVDFIVITPENAEEIFNQLANSDSPVVLFALTEEGYKNLSLNMAEILKVLSQQNAVIVAYENYYVETSRTIDEFNENK